MTPDARARLRELAAKVRDEQEIAVEVSILRDLFDALDAAERERDALLAQFKSTGYVPYLERMREIQARAEAAEARVAALETALVARLRSELGWSEVEATMFLVDVRQDAALAEPPR